MRIRALLPLSVAALLALTVPARARGGSDLLSAVAALKDHITGTKRLTAGEIDAHKRTIDANRTLFGSSQTIITACFDLVATYDRVNGPLWIARGQFDRRTAVNDIDWTIYHVMQYIMDEVYTANGIANYEAVLRGFTFGSSTNFPGAVSPPSTSGKTHAVTINGSYPDTYGRETMHADRPARKPTGTYLAPGSIVTVTVPSSMVGKGYTVRVGAHSWDLSNRPWVRRLDRCTLLYDINAVQTKIASPLGGGIYIEVPFRANAGIVTVRITDAVRSPYFSAKSFHSTTLAEWQNTERHHKAPWADFQSDKFMMQVPTSWIYNLADPVALLKDWDSAMDVMNDLMGFPRTRGKETMYPQVDVLFRASVYAPGYPSVNITYDPTRNYGGNHTHHLLRGPQKAASYEFHEQGHGYLFQKFPGETESNVNLLHVAVWNRGFGYDLDTAFRTSAGFSDKFRTLDHTAIAWMMCENFKQGTIMEPGEKAYQLKGHAKFVDIARMFGWTVLGDYWKSFNDDYENNVVIRTDIDSLLFRLSMSVGVDVTPLFHFWGVHPDNPGALQLRMRAANLKTSTAIFDTIRKYETLVPANKQAYQSFAFSWWQRVPQSTGNWTERDHAKIWNTYDETYADAVRINVRRVLALYYDGYQAKVSDVGVGCIATGKAPVLAGSSPVIGTRIVLAIANATPNAPSLFLLGQPHPGTSLGHGCTLYVDLAKPMVPIFAVADSYGIVMSPWFELASSMPPGMSLGVQGAVQDAATRPLGQALSNGLLMRIGY